MDALEILYRANQNCILFWVESQNKLKYKVQAGAKDNNHWLSLAKSHKKEIIELLVRSDITSEPRKLPIIYRGIAPATHLSFAQQRLWFLEKLDASTAYTIPLCLVLKEYDAKAIRYSLIEIFQRHTVLRSKIKHHQETSGQFCYPLSSVDIVEKKIPDSEYFRELQNDINYPFDLENSFPFRIVLYRISERDNDEENVELLINFHHIAFDGWSLACFLKEFDVFYEYFKYDREISLDQLSYQYSDYAQWQFYSSGSELEKQQLDYWVSYLSDAENLELPQDKPRPERITYRGKNIPFSIPSKQSQALKRIAQQEGTSLYSLMLTCFFVLLHKVSNQKDMTIGSLVANRDIPHSENLIGFFVNTQAIRCVIDPELSFRYLYAEVNKWVLQAIKHQHVPFEKVVEALKIERSLNKHPLFQVLFSLENSDAHADQSLADNHWYSIRSLTDQYNVAKYDLSLYLNVSSENIGGYFNYNIDLFEDNTIIKLSERFKKIIEAVVQQWSERNSLPLKEISVLLEEEIELLKTCHPNSYVPLPQKRVTELFTEQAAKTPENAALCFSDRTLSYRELDEISNQLSRWLSNNMPIQKDSIVALVMERSLELVYAILAIHKAGAAYVPIDPSLPTSRKQFILYNAGCELILTQQYIKLDLISELADFNPEQIVALNSLYFLEQLKAPREERFCPSDLAYVIYTSGTTGNAKGVMIQHDSLFNRIQWMQRTYPLKDRDIILQKTPYSFDVSVWELVWAHSYGAKLVMAPPNAHKNPRILYQIILEKKITVVHFVPSMFAVFLQYIADENLRIPSKLRYIFTSGEALPFSLVRQFRQLNENSQLHNLYGPTETTIDSTFYDCSHCVDEVPIGKPIDNTRIYVLDDNLKQVPFGTPGELYISGLGVSRGYLNRPELNSLSFIDNPYTPDDDVIPGTERMYKTGDIVRLHHDGNIHYLGRRDFQVKLRGLRIELGEIEAAMAQLDSIRQSVARVWEHADQQVLVAYYVSERKIEEELIAHVLKDILPDYMVPEIYIHLKSLPLSVNGKLDRKSLPTPEFTTGDYVAPESADEIATAAIWSKLLALDSISVTGDFFRMGGNSISAITVCHKMSECLNKDVPIALLFEARNIRTILVHLEGNKRKPILPCNQSPVPLSFSQKRLWFIYQYEQGTNAYNIPLLFKLREYFPAAIQWSIQKILERHKVLNSTVCQIHEEACLLHREDSVFTIHNYDLSKDAFESKLKNDINYIFDLEKHIPIRVCLYRVLLNKENAAAVTEDYLLINIHHIAFDGWSTGIFIRELKYFYACYRNEIKPTLKKPAIQYEDYAVWQGTYLLHGEQARQLAYWRSKLEGYETIRLPLSFPRPNKSQYQGKNLFATFPIDLSHQLISRAKEYKVSLFHYLLAAFYILLYKYTGQRDIVIGTPLANRQYGETRNLIGLFVNILPIRNSLTASQTFLEFLTSVSESVLAVQNNQDIPFEVLVDDLGIPRDASRHPIYQVLFSTDEFNSENGSIAMSGDESSNYKLGLDWCLPQTLGENYEVAKQDIGLYVTRTDECLSLSLNYASALFSEQAMEQFMHHYMRLLVDIVAYPQQKIADFCLLSESQRNALVYDFNKTDNSQALKSTIVELFRQECQATPEKTAIIFNDTQLIYRELEKRVNLLASYFYHRKAIKSGDLVPVCMTRSVDLVVVILAVMKTGAAYVPIGVDYPVARINLILEDTKARFLMVDNNCSLPEGGINPAVELMRYTGCKYEGFTDESSLPVVNPNDLAYVIYTSGTTGKPKGVMVEQHAFANFIFQFESSLQEPQFLSLTTFTFDIFGLEYSLPLIRGGTLILSRLENAVDVLKQNNTITVIQQTPSVYRSILAGLNQRQFKNVTCLVGGEALDNELLEKLQTTFGRVINVYGPTETVIWSTQFDCSSSNDPLIIGKPLSNERCYIFDENMYPVPAGVIGELYIAGAGLARGYLNRKALTEQRFIAHPFMTEVDSASGYDRLYKTGDLVFMRFDGNIEYIGRSDNQVKIQGHRIEIGEIESAISAFEGVEQSVVTVHQHNHQSFIVAYYIAKDAFDEKLLEETIYTKLPDFMQPAAYFRLESFPLSANGKLDRNALPVPAIRGETFVAPETDLEKQLCQIWEDVLRVSKVGVNDDFFKLGGNSLLAITLMNRIRQDLDVNLRLQSIFEYRRISSIIRNGLGHQHIHIPKANVERYPLSYAQQRLWFIEQLDSESSAYHIPILLRLKDGCLNCIQQAVKCIFDRHQVLRTSIGKDEEGFYQWIHPVDEFRIKTVEFEPDQFDSVVDEILRAPFDLTKEIPARVTLLNSVDNCYLLLNFHHITFDGWSIEIFLNELDTLCRALGNGINPALNALPIQYKDYAVWQRRYLEQGEFARQLAYWRHQLRGFEPLSLISDYPRPKQFDYAGDQVVHEIDVSTSLRLIELAKNQGVSLNSLLLSAFYVVLHKYTGQTDLVVGSPVANRHVSQIKNLIGFFVNSLSLRVKLNRRASFVDFLEQVQQVNIDAQNHQDIPFDAVVDALELSPDGSRHPVFQIMFATQDFGEHLPFSDWYEIKQDLISQPYAKYDLSVVLTQSGNTITCTMNYASRLFEAATISSLLKHYVYVLQQITQAPQASIAKINVLSLKEQQQFLLPGLHKDERSEVVAADERIEQHFSVVVKNEGKRCALNDGEREMSYQELDEKSSKLAQYIAHKLYAQDSGPQKLFVCLVLDNTIELAIAQLAVLKAGAAFVPIDVRNPPERIAFILEDTQAPLLITSENLLKTVPSSNTIGPGCSFEVLVIDKFDYQTRPSPLQDVSGARSDLAYVIYTSGTEGKPKGVMVEHRQILTTLCCQKKKYQFDSDSSLLLAISPAFDASIAVVYGALLNGAELLFTQPGEFSSSIVNKTTHLIISASVLESLKPEWFPNLRYLVYGADAASDAALNRFQKALIFVEYGVTEASICSTGKAIKAGDTPTIGTPFETSGVYLVNEDLQLTPPGCIGEIVLSGPGVARGYLNLPDKTKKSFIHWPWQTLQKVSPNHLRLYRTGDFARYLKNGELIFCGRRDNQIKLRGHRIELNEINRLLETFPSIQRAVSLILEDEPPLLVSYYCSESPLESHTVFSFLKKKVPDFMLPTVIQFVPEIPLTFNGKVDVSKLPKPEKMLQTHQAPQTDIQIALFSIWKDTLNHENFGIEDDFFTVGGDSVLSIQLSAALKDAGLSISVRDIFTHRTIHEQSALLASGDLQMHEAAEQGMLEGHFPLLAIQQWFFSLYRKGYITQVHHWNQSFLIRTPELNTDILKNNLSKLITHHDALRINFQRENNQFIQFFSNDQLEIPLKQLTVTGKSDSTVHEVLTDWQSNFNIEKGPLVCFGYLHGYKDGSARVFIACHHLIFDAVSWRIILNHLLLLTNGQPLPEKTSSYRQWVERMKNYGEKYPEEKVYWQGVLSRMPPVIVKEINGFSPENKTLCTSFSLTKAVSSTLLSQVNIAYNTEINDLLLVAMAQGLKAWNGSCIQGVFLEGHGREPIFDDIDVSQTVGWFTSRFPVGIELLDDLSLTLQLNKELMRNIPNKGVGFGCFSKNDSTMDQQRISLNYLGQISHESGDWKISNEGSGNSIGQGNTTPYSLVVNGAFVEGEVRFYLEGRLDRKVLEEIATTFKFYLEKIATFCLERIQGHCQVTTPSDYLDFVSYEVFDPKTGAGNSDHMETWIVLPPGDAHGECYFQHLIPLMSDKRVVVFNNFFKYLETRKQSATQALGFADLAAQAIAHIKTVQATGPYRVLGWSFGGVLGLEITKLLERSGSEVTHLVMVDAYFGLKKVLDHAESALFLKDAEDYKENIHYRYLPDDNLRPLKAAVSLIKATRLSKYEQPEVFRSLENVYLNTVDNYLQDYIPKHSFTVLHFSCGHYDFFTDRKITEKVVACLKAQVKSLPA